MALLDGYTAAGFDDFLSRAIDAGDPVSHTSTTQSRELNFDQAQTTGALGSVWRIGKITIDGVNGRIIVADENVDRILIGNLE